MKTEKFMNNKSQSKKGKASHFNNNAIAKRHLVQIKAGDDFIITEDCIDM